jgi:hypothetical protein
MKKELFIIFIIALLLGTTIIQVGAKQSDNFNTNENQTEVKSSGKLVFYLPFGNICFGKVNDLNISAIYNKVFPAGDDESSVFICVRITGIVADSYPMYIGSQLFPNIKYEYEPGDILDIRCTVLSILVSNLEYNALQGVLLNARVYI